MSTVGCQRFEVRVVDGVFVRADLSGYISHENFMKLVDERVLPLVRKAISERARMFEGSLYPPCGTSPIVINVSGYAVEDVRHFSDCIVEIK